MFNNWQNRMLADFYIPMISNDLKIFVQNIFFVNVFPSDGAMMTISEKSRYKWVKLITITLGRPDQSSELAHFRTWVMFLVFQNLQTLFLVKSQSWRTKFGNSNWIQLQLVKKLIFNCYFRKNQFLTKISFFDQNFNFWPKFQFLTKISIFHQNSIFDLNFNFWPKFGPKFLNSIGNRPNINFRHVKSKF